MRSANSAQAAGSPPAMPGKGAKRVPKYMDKHGSYLRMMADAIACLMKQPRTVIELMDATGREEHGSGQHVTVSRYIRVLRDEGLIYVAGWHEYQTNRFVERYGWQPSVLFHADAPHPRLARSAK